MTDTDVWDEITADASSFEGLTTEAGSELSDLIRQVSGVGQELSAAETVVSNLKKKRDRYLYNLIPDKMNEVGLQKVEVDGNAVSLATYVQGTMPKDPLQREVALTHLRDIGAGDFIKNVVSVSFGISQDNRARSLYSDLEDAGLYPEDKTWVEPSTLKKLIRERVENNQEIDLELFKAHIGTVAKIKGK